VTGKAHQRIIREQVASGESARRDLFSEEWRGLDLSIASTIVRPITYATAARVIHEYEWLGTMPAVTFEGLCFGIIYRQRDGGGEMCGGAVVYSPEYSANMASTWDRYGFTGRIILLARGACAHWAHEHSASRLIRRSMRMLPKQFEIVTATVDARAGEIGTIYQACGFHYVGVMPGAGGAPRTAARDAEGRILTRRTLRHRYGTTKPEELARVPGIILDTNPAKGRYFAFRSRGAQLAKDESAIAHLLKPYPKRNA
jgi:hypothetical protein